MIPMEEIFSFINLSIIGIVVQSGFYISFGWGNINFLTCELPISIWCEYTFCYIAIPFCIYIIGWPLNMIIIDCSFFNSCPQWIPVKTGCLPLGLFNRHYI